MYNLNTFPVQKDGKALPVLQSAAIWLFIAPMVILLVCIFILSAAGSGDEAAQEFVKHNYLACRNFLSSVPIWSYGLLVGSLCLVFGLPWS